MPNSLRSPRHEALRKLIAKERKSAGLTQADVAAKVRRYQSYVANVESGQRRVDVVEFLELAEAIGFNPQTALRKLSKIKR